jgi:hypothetical protein
MSSSAPSDGRVQALNVCAYLVFPDPDPQGADKITLQFYVAGYRLIGNSYRRISNTLRIFFNIYTNETFGCYPAGPIVFTPENRPEVLKDDMLGVYVPDEDCHQFSANPPLYSCSAHLNIIDPDKNCSQALYFSNTRLEDNRMPDRVDARNGHPVDLFLNVDVFIGMLYYNLYTGQSRKFILCLTVEPDSSQEIQGSSNSSHNCAVKFTDSENTAVIVAISTIITVGIFLVLVIIGLVSAVVSHNKQKVKQLKKSVLSGTTRHSDHQQHNNQFNALHHLSRTESNHSYVINSLGGHSTRFGTEQSRTHLEQSSHSYVINSLDQLKNVDGADEELYWAPASKEEDLKQQIKKSKVDEAHKNDIE